MQILNSYYDLLPFEIFDDQINDLKIKKVRKKTKTKEINKKEPEQSILIVEGPILLFAMTGDDFIDMRNGTIYTVIETEFNTPLIDCVLFGSVTRNHVYCLSDLTPIKFI